MDDIIIFAHNQLEADATVAKILGEFEGRVETPPESATGEKVFTFLGVNYHLNSKQGTLKIGQEKLTEKVLKKFD